MQLTERRGACLYVHNNAAPSPVHTYIAHEWCARVVVHVVVDDDDVVVVDDVVDG